MWWIPSHHPLISSLSLRLCFDLLLVKITSYQTPHIPIYHICVFTGSTAHLHLQYQVASFELRNIDVSVDYLHLLRTMKGLDPVMMKPLLRCMTKCSIRGGGSTPVRLLLQVSAFFTFWCDTNCMPCLILSCPTHPITYLLLHCLLKCLKQWPVYGENKLNSSSPPPTFILCSV